MTESTHKSTVPNPQSLESERKLWDQEERRIMRFDIAFGAALLLFVAACFARLILIGHEKAMNAASFSLAAASFVSFLFGIYLFLFGKR